MKKIGIIGSGTDISGFLNPMKHEVTVEDISKQIDPTTIATFHICPRIRIEMPYVDKLTKTNHKTPYKFHK